VTEEPTRKLAVLLHADVISSTTLVQLDETVAHRRIRDVFQRFSETIANHGGIAHEIRGDALVAEFPRASDAVTAALEFQADNILHNDELSDEVRPVLRVGVAIGEVVIADNTVTGEGIILAQRLEQLAEPGGVCIQGAAYETMPKRLPFDYQNLGEQELKGFAEPVKVFAVTQQSLSKMPVEQKTEALDLVEKPSIAVLPLTNMSGDPEQEFFADGMTEDIITALCGFSSLFVIARNSTFVYKDTAQDIKKIGAELGVRYVLEGSVRKSATRVRITAQLIKVASGAHLWAQRYDRVPEDVFELQDEITQMIVAAIQPELETAERERALRKTPGNLDSWEYYQRGMWHYYKMSSEESTRAETFFNQALINNPQYAPALAALALVAHQRLILNFTANEPIVRQDLIDHGLKFASAAVRADDKDAFPQFVYGRLLALNGDFDQAIDRLNLAIDINPNYALAYYGLGYTLTVSGHPDEALTMFDKALRLSPMDHYRWAFYTMRSMALLLIKDYDGAVEWGRRGIRDQEDIFWAYAHVASALGHHGRSAEAEQVFADLMRVKPDFSSATIDETIRFRHAADREYYLEGLRKAGLPE
jgi:TolB-like protein